MHYYTGTVISAQLKVRVFICKDSDGESAMLDSPLVDSPIYYCFNHFHSKLPGIIPVFFSSKKKIPIAFLFTGQLNSYERNTLAKQPLHFRISSDDQKLVPHQNDNWSFAQHFLALTSTRKIHKKTQ